MASILRTPLSLAPPLPRLNVNFSSPAPLCVSFRQLRKPQGKCLQLRESMRIRGFLVRASSEEAAADSEVVFGDEIEVLKAVFCYWCFWGLCVGWLCGILKVLIRFWENSISWELIILEGMNTVFLTNLELQFDCVYFEFLKDFRLWKDFRFFDVTNWIFLNNGYNCIYKLRSTMRRRKKSL